MDLTLIIPAFLAGLLTFLAPCTLPLVPAYLGFVSGVPLEDLKDPEKAKLVRRKIFLNGLFFVIGFSIVFIALGTLISFVGATILAPYRVWLTRIAGAFVILFGLFMLNVLRIPFLTKERHIQAPKFFQQGRPLNSFILGSAFAFGWTPCVGPVLGAILLIASTSTTVFQGALLLTVFSLGLGIPFLVIAAAIGSASKNIERFSKYLKVVTVVGGILLIFLGILLLTDSMALLIAWGFRFLRFINYDAILNYL